MKSFIIAVALGALGLGAVPAAAQFDQRPGGSARIERGDRGGPGFDRRDGVGRPGYRDGRGRRLSSSERRRLRMRHDRRGIHRDRHDRRYGDRGRRHGY